MRANRPTSISHPGGTDTFSWNALGQRMRATFWGPGCVRRYFYDGQRVLEETNDAGGIYARYIAEGSSYYDPLLLFARCSGEVRYPLYDGIGTTQRLVDQNGTVTDSYTLDAFGKPFSSTGTTRNPYRYGGAWDYFTDYLGSGLLQLGHRFYWPEVGRFIQQDPAGEGVNWYAYVDDNPVTGIDPEGLAYLKYYQQPHTPLGCNRGTLVLYHDSGRAWGEWGAHSGGANGGRSIVGGRYRVDPRMISYRRPWSRNWPVGSWGQQRLTLDPTPRTRHAIGAAGRSGGFFLHGGTHGTTTGCVRLQDDDLGELFGILKGIGTPVELEVQYSYPMDYYF